VKARFGFSIVASVLGVLLSTTATAAEVLLLSTTSAKEALGEIIPAFERATGHTVRASFTPGSAMGDRFAKGVDADLLVAPAEFSEPLLASGRLVAGSRADFARSVAAVAIRAGTPKPDILSIENFRQALLNARSISYSRGASGLQFIEVVRRLGITEAIKQKSVLPEPGELVGSVVARGAAEIGIQQVSELLPVTGIEIVGPLPPQLRKDIVYSVSALPGRKGAEAASAFTEFLRSPAVAPVLRKHGLEPVSVRR
jgi:molybdate transport system substrate-binding protein